MQCRWVRPMKGIILFILLTIASRSLAQNALRLQHINVEDGLSQSSVYSTMQDAHGFIWFATGDGLNRYDGKEFITYKGRLTDSLPGMLKDRNVNSILVADNRNRLWFTADAGVYCMDTKTGLFHLLLNKHESECAAMIIGTDERDAWAVVAKKGIYSISLSQFRCRLYPFTDRYQTNKLEIARVNNGISNGKGLWIADSKGLLFFDKQTRREKRVIENDSLSCVYQLKSGTLLLSAYNGAWLYEPLSGSKEFIPVTIAGKKDICWKSVAEDTVQHIVYMTEEAGNHICKLNLATRRYETLALPATNIERIYADRSQNLWVGTDGDGVYRLDMKAPKFYCYAPGAGSKENFMVKSIYRDDHGMIWMGVYDHGLVKYDPATGCSEQVNPACSHEGQLISVIMKDSTGNLLVTLNGTILWLDPANGRTLKQLTLPYYKDLSPSKAVIYSMVEWKKDHYLAGTNIGLYTVKYEGGRLSATMPESFLRDSFANGWAYSMVKATDGSIYVGVRSGFAHIRMLSDTVKMLLDHGFDNLPVRHFYKNKNGPILWLATEQGLIAYNEHTKQHVLFDEATGLTNSYVYSILASNDSTLWISTNNGLFNIKAHYSADGSISARFFNYTSKDGLQSNEFNTGAYQQCSDGTLIFGGIAGVNWFRPGAIEYNPYSAQPALTGIWVNDTLYAADTAIYMNTLELPYKRNTISLTLKALEFTRPEQNMYAYKLEGLETEWVYTTNDKVRYSNLPPGNYRFLLRVRNNEAAWNDKPLVLTIIIRPPWWETWWFRTMVLLAVIAVVYVIVRYYIHQKIMVKTRELEKQHALNMERLRISKDVHDDIGSGLSKISLISALANKKLDGNLILGRDIQHISSISKELVDNMRDLIWVLNPENTTLDNLISRMREYCSDYLDGIDISPVLDLPADIPLMHISREAQRNIFSTVKEAMNNCVKHSAASELRMSVTTGNNQLVITISDNGRGIPANRTAGNGLRNMKQRIESIGGTYAIMTPDTGGTRINMTIALENLKGRSTETTAN